MLEKAISLILSMRKQFFKYFITGVTGVIIDIATLYLFKEFFYMRPVVAVVVNQIIVLNFVFFVNKYWSFESEGMTTVQMFRFFIVALSNYVFAVVWMWTMNEKLSVNYLIARTLNIALSVSWNFLLYKYYVYKVIPVPEVETVQAVRDEII